MPFPMHLHHLPYLCLSLHLSPFPAPTRPHSSDQPTHINSPICPKNSAHLDAYLKSTFINICLLKRLVEPFYYSLFERIFANVAKNSAHFDAYLKSTFIYIWLLERFYRPNSQNLPSPILQLGVAAGGLPGSHQALSLRYSQHNQDDRQRSYTIIEGVEHYTGPERVGAPEQKGERQPDDKKDGE